MIGREWFYGGCRFSRSVITDIRPKHNSGRRLAPLLAVVRVLIMRLWVEDALGDRKSAKAMESS